MIPVVGDAAGKGTKVTRKVLTWFKVGNRYFSSSARKAAYKLLFDDYGAKVADAIWDARNSKLVRKAIEDVGKGLKEAWQAHHIIPKELITSNPTLRNAIDQGFDFNKLGNLIPLSEARHLGSHGNYTTQVTELLKEIERELPKLTDKQKIEKVVEVIMKKINNTSGKINELTFSL
jgi:hypothetical protein